MAWIGAQQSGFRRSICRNGGCVNSIDRVRNMISRGFTLIESVLVIIITGILASVIGIFLKPAINSYFNAQNRAALTDQADTALRRMAQDIRIAVPNSVRTPNNQCFELIPTSSGGRYRMAPDTLWDNKNPDNKSTYLDGTQPIKQLDILSVMSAVPSAGDWLVIDNQNGNDVYTGVNRAKIGSIATPPSSTLGTNRMVMDSSSYPAGFQFPTGYNGGRFVIVPNAQQAVFYVCSGTGVNAQGNGTGTLYRLSGYGFNASYPSACPSTDGASVLASNVQSCNFVYSPTQGATQQNGFVWMQLVLTLANESVSLAFGQHVDNAP